MIEKDIRDELGSEVADDDTSAAGLGEETFAARELFPTLGIAADDDAFGGVVENDLLPEEEDGAVERIFEVVMKLLAETFLDETKKPAAVEAHEIALKVQFSNESFSSVIVGGAAKVLFEGLDAAEGALIVATAKRSVDKAAVPPFVGNIVEEMMDDTVAEGGGEDFAANGTANKKSDAATRLVGAIYDGIAEIHEIFGIVYFEAVLVISLAFTSAGFEISSTEAA